MPSPHPCSRWARALLFPLGSLPTRSSPNPGSGCSTLESCRPNAAPRSSAACRRDRLGKEEEGVQPSPAGRPHAPHKPPVHRGHTGNTGTATTELVSSPVAPDTKSGPQMSSRLSGTVFPNAAPARGTLTSELTISSGTLCTIDTVAVDSGTCGLPFLLCSLRSEKGLLKRHLQLINSCRNFSSGFS